MKKESEFPCGEFPCEEFLCSGIVAVTDGFYECDNCGKRWEAIK